VPTQTGHLEFAMLDASGRITKLLPEPGNVQSTQVSLHPATPVYTMPFTTGSLAPGAYRVRVSLYDGPVGTASSTRALLATSEASFTITATRSIGAVTVIPLPEFTNVGVPTATGYRVEISNKSNVAVDIDLDLRLQGPAGAPVAQVTQRVAIRPDEAFKTLDISAGTITFAPNGVYQAIASVTGVDPPPITARALGVLPATRIEIQQTLQPGTIAPANEKKIRVDIRLKGVQQ
jgi:hypothetical protein